jgi:hypothetical protein
MNIAAFLLAASLLLVVPSQTEAAAPPATWGQLEPGPHAVGFRTFDRYDRSRVFRFPRDLEGRPRDGERARPIQVSVWYPAEASGRRMTWGDYLALDATQTRFGEATEARREAAERTVFGFVLLRDLPADARGRLKALEGLATRDARPKAGSYPVVLWSLGSPVLYHVTPEYLASHGYVVVTAPRNGPVAGSPADVPDVADIETKVRDMEFLLNVLGQEVPQADLGSIATVGFSAGGVWALSMAMRNPNVRAVVSLDTVMLFNDGVSQQWRTQHYYAPDRARVPILNLVRKQFADRDDMKVWEGLRHADRTYVLFPDEKLDHFDFAAMGYATTLVGGRPELKDRVAAAFHAFHRYTLAFLDAHVKGRAEAKAFLARSPEQNGLPAGFAVARRDAAEPAPPRDLEVVNAFTEQGADAVLAAYRRLWREHGRPPGGEALLNTVGYNLLGTGAVEDAIKVFQTNVEAFPQSSNVHDSLSDAYLAAGRRAEALELAEKALSMLESEAGLTPERKELIRQSAAAKVEQLRAPR